MTKGSIFFWSCLVSCAVFLVAFHYLGHSRRRTALSQIADGIYVSGQLSQIDMPRLVGHKIRTVIDLRPDGEDPSQISSKDMEQAVTHEGMSFHYIPVEHEDVPSAQAVLLAMALLHTGTPAVLYCRTGNRAVRTYALMLALDANGPDEAAILRMANQSGHPVDDMQTTIHERIAARRTTAGAIP